MTSINIDDVLFWIVRHGRTQSNDLKLYRAWSNAQHAQLDAAGRKDAAAAAAYLRRLNAPLELILADTLDRTMETAEIVAGAFDPSPRIVAVRGLHPLNVGEWTGTPKADHPPEDMWADPTSKPPGGESLDEFNKRQLATFKAIFAMVDDQPRGSVVTSGHGSTVSFLHNQVFKDKPEIGYEGLVEPGGVIAVTQGGLVPLTRLRGQADDDESEGDMDGRESAESAGYMELPDLEGNPPVKDADCKKVYEEGGVSSEFGCCDRFKKHADAEREFECGTCIYVRDKVE